MPGIPEDLEAERAALMARLRQMYDNTTGQLAYGSPRWVMDRAWYDRLRAVLVPVGQEQERASAHRDALTPADGSSRCPVCPAGPFRSQAELAGHIRQQSDLACREPLPGDRLFAIPVTVRDGAGEPHLETSA